MNIAIEHSNRAAFFISFFKYIQKIPLFFRHQSASNKSVTENL